MSAHDRDMVDEAMQIIDNTTLVLPERAHLVALHRFHLDVTKFRVDTLLRALDGEHSHIPDCPTCDWISQQPEWGEILHERQEDAERNARDAY